MVQTREVGAGESSATAGALVAYAAGLPAFVLIKVLAPGYFARQDTKTPVRIAILCLVVNVALNLALMGPLAHVGIALATTLAGWLNVGLLAAGLARRGYLRPDSRLKRRLPRMVAAAAGMAALLWAVALGLEGPLETAGVRIAALAAIVVAGLVGYGALAAGLGALSPGELRALLSRRRRGREQGQG
jgi:putative peptidoglycan lipid II flippase